MWLAKVWPGPLQACKMDYFVTIVDYATHLF